MTVFTPLLHLDLFTLINDYECNLVYLIVIVSDSINEFPYH